MVDPPRSLAEYFSERKLVILFRFEQSEDSPLVLKDKIRLEVLATASFSMLMLAAEL
jgi:hypothetical protein